MPKQPAAVSSSGYADRPSAPAPASKDAPKETPKEEGATPAMPDLSGLDLS